MSKLRYSVCVLLYTSLRTAARSLVKAARSERGRRATRSRA